MALRIANWNIEWARPDTSVGSRVASFLKPLETDIICLCETSVDFLSQSHNALLAEEDFGYVAPSWKRKLTLWSATPWQDTVTHLAGGPAGRFAAGTVSTDLGDLRVIGVCVPWQHAHVSTGRRDREAWEDHIAFLQALIRFPDVANPQLPTLLMGDFNQTIPPRYAPPVARDLLGELLDRFSPLPRVNPSRRIVCHILSTQNWTVGDLEELPARDGTGKLSDHFGERMSLS